MMTINEVDLAIKLADEALIKFVDGDESVMFEYDDDKVSHYKEEYQDIFDEYYDYYYNLITESAIDKTDVSNEELDLSIINDTDWFYIEMTDGDYAIAKGNIVDFGSEKGYHLFKDGAFFNNTAALVSRESISFIRPATPEEISKVENKIAEINGNIST